MQNSAALVALSLAHVADLAVGFIHQNQRFAIRRNIVGAGLEAANLIHARGTPYCGKHRYSHSRPPGGMTRARSAPPGRGSRVHNSCLPRYSNLSSGRERPWRRPLRPRADLSGLLVSVTVQPWLDWGGTALAALAMAYAVTA